MTQIMESVDSRSVFFLLLASQFARVRILSSQLQSFAIERRAPSQRDRTTRQTGHSVPPKHRSATISELSTALHRKAQSSPLYLSPSLDVLLFFSSPYFRTSRSLIRLTDSSLTSRSLTLAMQYYQPQMQMPMYQQPMMPQPAYGGYGMMTPGPPTGYAMPYQQPYSESASPKRAASS